MDSTFKSFLTPKKNLPKITFLVSSNKYGSYSLQFMFSKIAKILGHLIFPMVGISRKTPGFGFAYFQAIRIVFKFILYTQLIIIIVTFKWPSSVPHLQILGTPSTYPQEVFYFSFGSLGVIQFSTPNKTKKYFWFLGEIFIFSQLYCSY